MKITGNVQISTRGMGPTQRELNEWLEHPVTAEFFRRSDQMIDDARKVCETARDVEEWRKAQGAIEALRRVKGIPAIIESEMK